ARGGGGGDAGADRGAPAAGPAHAGAPGRGTRGAAAIVARRAGDPLSRRRARARSRRAFVVAHARREEKEMTPNGVNPAAQGAQPQEEEEQRPLERFGRDLTETAEQGKLDPVIGRDEEIRRVIQVLSRRTKNNPVLIGDPGVGKTAIVEG